MLGEKFKTYLPILVFIMCAFSCKENNRSSLLFDMEKVEGNYFISQNSKRISNSLAQSSDYSKSGNYSAKIDFINPYALSYKFYDLKKRQSNNNFCLGKNWWSKRLLKIGRQRKKYSSC